MRQNEKMLVNMSLLFFTFAYLLQGKNNIVFFLAIGALLMGIISHSGNTFVQVLPKAIIVTSFWTGCCVLTGIVISGSWMLAIFVNSACALLWEKSSWKAIEGTVIVTAMVYVFCMVIILWISFLPAAMMKNDYFQLFTKVQVIFLPMLSAAFHKGIVTHKKQTGKVKTYSYNKKHGTELCQKSTY